jgi:hypothetical protein
MAPSSNLTTGSVLRDKETEITAATKHTEDTAAKALQETEALTSAHAEVHKKVATSRDHERPAALSGE